MLSFIVLIGRYFATINVFFFLQVKKFLFFENGVETINNWNIIIHLWTWLIWSNIDIYSTPSALWNSYIYSQYYSNKRNITKNTMKDFSLFEWCQLMNPEKRFVLTFCHIVFSIYGTVNSNNCFTIIIIRCKHRSHA